MINLNFIKSKHIKKKILISESLNKIFKFDKNEYLVLHDGVDIENFDNFKNTEIIKKFVMLEAFIKVEE